MPPTAPTIADIARQAGVGTATVDRVLNKRPGVNADTVQRVLQVVAEIGAPPQPGRPRGENFRFAYVLPADDVPFLGLVERQIAQAAGDFRHQHITEVTHRVPGADANEFAAGLTQLAAEGQCQGIALLAPDLPPVKLAINELVRSGLHVVTLFSDVAGSMRETHIGADNRAAGRTAGLLLARMVTPPRDTLLLSSQATRLSSEIERRIGFAQVLEERFPKLRLVRTPDLPADDAGASRALQRFLKKGDVDPARIAGLYNVGSGSVGIVRAIEAAGLDSAVGVVSHDFTDEHRTLLGNGGFAYVLHQDIHYCVLTAARVLRALCENVRGALNVVQPRVEILTAENLH
ncbi:MAG TPA: LacI family DNA-binding transcriptional regulator [Burkholderiaceae bacterium]